jgi:hypothetical protein
MPQIYKGYEVRKNMFSKRWYAYPACDLTTENKLEADSAQQLAQLIDRAVANKPNPWELPSVTGQLQAA